MARRRVSAAIALGIVFTLLGCHTMRFEVGTGQVGQVVHDRKSFFIGGLVPTKNVDLAAFCPNGAVTIGGNHLRRWPPQLLHAQHLHTALVHLLLRRGGPVTMRFVATLLLCLLTSCYRTHYANFSPQNPNRSGAAAAQAPERCADYEIVFPDGKIVTDQLKFGDLRLYPLELGKKATVTVQPAKTVTLGAGSGTVVTREVQGGVVGLMLDGRGRPLQLPADQQARIDMLTKWFDAVGLYPTA